MFITKRSLPRRTFLRGLNAAVALPLLEAMVPAVTALARTAASPRLRFGAVYIPNGTIMGSPQFKDLWTPATVGRDFEFSPILKPLEPFRERLVIVSNLARSGEDVHAVGPAAWLSGVAPKRTEAEDVRVGTTLDQVLAKQIGQETPFLSLELATEDFAGYIGTCSPGYSCAYMNTISWQTSTTPLPMEINPRVVFERMFGSTGTSAQRLARMRKTRSLLDSIVEDAHQLQRDLGVQDRVRLSESLDHVRELERRIQRTEAQNTAHVTTLGAPIGVPESFEEHVALMFDLLAVAYQSDLTRVFTFMMARELSNRTYPEIGITEGHHELSHHGNIAEKIAAHATINTYHVTQFARFVEKLRVTTDGDGSLLDHALILYGSGMSNGNAHSGGPLPLVAIGGGLGKGNRHILTPERTPLGNLWVGVADKFGEQLERVGDRTGRVDL